MLFGEGDIKCEEVDDGDGTDCCCAEPGPQLPLPVRRSMRADEELRLLCGPPSALIDVVGDVAASRAFRPGMENAMFVVEDAVDAFESLPGDGAVIESRRKVCELCCWLSRLRVAAAFRRICCGTPELSWSCCLSVDCPEMV